jgi:hypothetical protein
MSDNRIRIIPVLALTNAIAPSIRIASAVEICTARIAKFIHGGIEFYSSGCSCPLKRTSQHRVLCQRLKNHRLDLGYENPPAPWTKATAATSLVILVRSGLPVKVHRWPQQRLYPDKQRHMP